MRTTSGLRQLFYLAIGAQMLLSIGFAITAILGSNRYVFVLCFDMGFFIGGHYFSHSLVNPQSLSSQSWGCLSFIWNPYRTWAQSHSKMANLFAVGLTVRLLYFYVCVQLGLGLCYAILALPGIAIASLPDSATTRNFLHSFYMSSWLEILSLWVGAALGCEWRSLI